jgi:hypothetical protein
MNRAFAPICELELLDDPCRSLAARGSAATLPRQTKSGHPTPQSIEGDSASTLRSCNWLVRGRPHRALIPWQMADGRWQMTEGGMWSIATWRTAPSCVGAGARSARMWQLARYHAWYQKRGPAAMRRSRVETDRERISQTKPFILKEKLRTARFTENRKLGHRAGLNPTPAVQGGAGIPGSSVFGRLSGGRYSGPRATRRAFRSVSRHTMVTARPPIIATADRACRAFRFQVPPKQEA